MTKKILRTMCTLLTLLALSTVSASADENQTAINTDSLMREVEQSRQLQRLSPKYLNNYFSSDWRSNWFAGVQFGATAFIGSPIGCGDLFDRTTPTYSIFIGKWHTPYIGTRLMFQNGKFKNSDMEKHSFQAYHADFMYNVTNHFRAEGQEFRNWDVIPYLGFGLINGATLYHQDCPCDACNGSNNSFMLAYGIQGRYRVNPRLHITAEFGGIRTFSDFDGNGSRHAFCDNLLSASVGITVNIGKIGWKSPVDAKPYITQNDYLIANYSKVADANMLLRNQHLMDEETLNDLKKVLESEGLLEQYSYLFEGKAHNKRNYYSGLLSLRARLNAEKHPVKPMMTRRQMLESNDTIAKYLQSPVFFFFKRGTTKLTDISQLVNLDELVTVAKNHDLTLKVDGVADSSTGTPKYNARLSQRRANFIKKELLKRGMKRVKILAFSHGGVKKHDRPEEDRNSQVRIWLDPE